MLWLASPFLLSRWYHREHGWIVQNRVHTGNYDYISVHMLTGYSCPPDK